MRHEVIMPALGMAQDTGLIVSWSKAPGEAVGADEVLLEVETDKSTMEVPAGHDGYLAEVYAEAGEDVPVGVTIAVITAERPSETVRSSYGAHRAAEPVAAIAPEVVGQTAESPSFAPTPEPARAPASAVRARILASPKARRVAQIEGLDLGQLIEAGTPQPFHVKDLETLRALPEKATNAPAATGGSRRLTAMVPAYGFAAFCEWFTRETGTEPDAPALIASMAAAALRASGRTGDMVVLVEQFGFAHYLEDRAVSWLGAARAEDETIPALLVRDLRYSAVTQLALGAENTPAISLTRAGADTAITLECGPHQLGASAALSLITEFADRFGDPLRHLL